ncbi:hypothetical protein CCHOA_09355 [Corynebacterium choanae]|uniref:Uncharacterized protein n=1 Tax=Corynebacterium choanae TaxID=1862358 RepID=A0A3G6JDM6_9CORY|nr:hypothetical protein CCHOA_09355 [Corynebacterium choanae]
MVHQAPRKPTTDSDPAVQAAEHYRKLAVRRLRLSLASLKHPQIL